MPETRLGGSLAGAVVLYYAKTHTPIHFFLHALVTFTATFVTAYAVSLILPGQPRQPSTH